MFAQSKDNICIVHGPRWRVGHPGVPGPSVVVGSVFAIIFIGSEINVITRGDVARLAVEESHF